jgi:hypothetical protein
MLDVHLEGDPTPETGTGTAVTPEFVGANAMQSEKPITRPQASDTAIVMKTLLRRSDYIARPTGDSFIKRAFEAAGCNVNTSANTTVTTGATVGNIPVASTVGLDIGGAVIVALPDGAQMPMLIGDIAGSSIIPVMDLPTAPADGAFISRAFTITPNKMQKVPDDKLLTIIHGDKTNQTQYQDCAVTGIADIVFNPNETIGFEFTFGATDKITIEAPFVGSNNFQDRAASATVFNPYCQFAYSNADYSNALPAQYNKLISATFKPGITCQQVPGFGDDNCKNNVQAWMQTGEPATLSVDMLYDSDRLENFDDVNDDRYVSFIQPGTEPVGVSVGIFIPSAHIMAAPTKDGYGNNEHRLSVMYRANPTAMDTGSTSSDQDNQPWYLVLGDRSN